MSPSGTAPPPTEPPPSALRAVPARRRPRRLVASFAAVLAVVLGSAHLAAPTGAAPSVISQGPEAALSLGDTGPSVAAWQRQLNILATQGLTVDGIFGPSTEQATINFQRFFALPASGVMTVETRDTMRFLLGLTQPGYLGFGLVGDYEVAGFERGDAYCFDVRAGAALSLECSSVASGRVINAQVIAMGHPEMVDPAPFMAGTMDARVATVQIDPIDGPSVEATVSREALGLGRDVWLSPVPADRVAVVRALNADGGEIRRIVVEGTDTFLVLEFGDRGPAVATWQEQLNQAIGANLPITGVFGSATVEATRNLQRFFGLGVDGIVGPETRELMEFVLALQQQPDEGAQPLGDPVSGDLATPGYPDAGADTTAFLTDVRVARQDGFDRIVWEFDDAAPGFLATFVDPPIRERPSDQIVEVAGGAFLEITMSWATGFDLTGPEVVETYPGPDRIPGGATNTVTEVVRTQDFEQFMTWTIGLDERTEYSVVTLENPHRLVVDVRIPK